MTERAKHKISLATLAASGSAETEHFTPWVIPTPAPGVVPAGAGMALDADFSDIYAYAQSGYASGSNKEDLRFLGFPYLAELAQRPENRRIVGVIAQEATRRWGKVTSSGDEDKTAKIEVLETVMKRFRVQDVFRQAVESDGYFGIGHIFIDVGDRLDRDELRTPLILSPKKIRPNALKGIKTIEPIWASPAQVNSTDPLSQSFYRPNSWYVMAREVHHTRLITLVSREVPDILKPAFMWSGVSLSQLAKPYVDNWIRTRQSVSDLLHSFNVFTLKTNMLASLMGDGGDQMQKRAQLFNNYRDNRGLLMIDKETEDFATISAPLAGLSDLQAQSQQQMAAVCGIPLTKLLGTPPQGLNASSDGEISSFYDTISALQEHLLSTPIKYILDIIQLSTFGEVDASIGFEWESLADPDEVERETNRKTRAETAQIYINAGVIDPAEERARLAHEEESSYANLDLSIDIDPPADPSLMQPDADGGPDDGQDEPSQSESQQAQTVAHDEKPKRRYTRRMACDDFKESDHTRAANGQFGSGSGFDRKVGTLGGAALTTSQHHIDDDIVAKKIASGDYDVQVSPEFDIDGEKYRTVNDGHHSLAAALASGNEPNFIEQSVTDNDNMALLESGDIEGYLEAVHSGEGDYHNPVTKRGTF